MTLQELVADLMYPPCLEWIITEHGLDPKELLNFPVVFTSQGYTFEPEAIYVAEDGKIYVDLKDVDDEDEEEDEEEDSEGGSCAAEICG